MSFRVTWNSLLACVCLCVCLSGTICAWAWRLRSLAWLALSPLTPLPTALPPPSFCHLFLLCRCYFQPSPPLSPPLLSAPNLPPFLFFLTLFSPPSPSFSCYLSLFISHLFSAAGCLWSLQSTQGIETSISGRRGERSRPDRQDKRERERERRWEKLSHRLRVTLITVSWQRAHTHTHSLSYGW